MILNWGDGNNSIFESSAASDEAQQFKQSKRGQWIAKMPKFKDFAVSDADKNLAKSHLKFLPLGLLLGVISDTFHSDLGPILVRWINQYRLKTHLFSYNIGDKR